MTTEQPTTPSTEEQASKNTLTLQLLAADYFAMGSTLADIAYELKVKYQTVLRWQQTATFKKRVAMHKRFIKEQAEMLQLHALYKTYNRLYNEDYKHSTKNADLIELIGRIELQGENGKIIGKTPQKSGKRLQKDEGDG